MSVSDPLFKPLKSHIYKLVTEQPIRDDHKSLQGFCEVLEMILRKGFLISAGSLFDFAKRDYWQCIDQLELIYSAEEYSSHRAHPFFSVVTEQARASAKVTTSQGRGRYFIRLALQNKMLHSVVTLLSADRTFLLTWYDPQKSILTDPILLEILVSLLRQVSEVTFQLCLANHSFLDDTWKLPVYEQLLLCPSSDLGIRLHHLNGRVIIASLVPGSIAADNGHIEVGDVLDEMFGKSLRNITKGTMPRLLKKYKDTPVSLSITKLKYSDDSVFHPIDELLKNSKKSGSLSRDQSDSVTQSTALDSSHTDKASASKDNNEKSEYLVTYVGKSCLGQNGRVDFVEPTIQQVLHDKNSHVNQSVIIIPGKLMY